MCPKAVEASRVGSEVERFIEVTNGTRHDAENHADLPLS
jgi:hypothetical protein